ncbi:hypothetical protein HanIR_Chr07g0314071 [Helianthus annuus]|nr:hypothetical protein HanIR_Chr07g0314071 [Helianthus annuus]
MILRLIALANGNHVSGFVKSADEIILLNFLISSGNSSKQYSTNIGNKNLSDSLPAPNDNKCSTISSSHFLKKKFLKLCAAVGKNEAPIYMANA